ncbi:hypothetical protein OF83DRAFT_1087967 [Amylostereum chailletii]|nr:hypothetical protein OF83DRAFT_1087967 [Amylostereum chailletii]
MPLAAASTDPIAKASMTPQQKATLTRKRWAIEKAENAHLAQEAHKKDNEPPTGPRASKTTAMKKKVWQTVAPKKQSQKRERAASTTAPAVEQVPKKKWKATVASKSTAPVLTIASHGTDGRPDQAIQDDSETLEHDGTVMSTSKRRVQPNKEAKTATVHQHQDDDSSPDVVAGLDDNDDDFFQPPPTSVAIELSSDATAKSKVKATKHTLIGSGSSHIKRNTEEDDIKPEIPPQEAGDEYTDYVLSGKGAVNITAQNPKLRAVLNHTIRVNVPKLLFFENAYPGPSDRYLLINTLIASADEHNLSELSAHLKNDQVYALKLSEAPHDQISNIRSEIYRDNVRSFVFGAYGLDKFKTPGAIAIAVASLLSDNAYIFPGNFVNGQWKPGQPLPFCNDVLTRLANKLWFGDTPRHAFPNELYAINLEETDEDGDDESKEYRLPRAMVAFLAAAIHAALDEWSRGSQSALPNGFSASRYSKVYHDHLATLDSLGSKVEAMVLALLYETASGSTQSEDEKPVIGTPNPLIGSSKDVERALLSRRR